MNDDDTLQRHRVLDGIRNPDEWRVQSAPATVGRRVTLYLYENGEHKGGVTVFETHQTPEDLVAAQNARLVGSGLEYRLSPPNIAK